MSDDVLTQHVLELARGVDLSSDEYQRVLNSLGYLLEAELHRRNIFYRPASYLGYDQQREWEDPEMVAEAAHDCYCYAILSRLTNLISRATDGENIDGHVLLNIRHFVTERQKGNDRTGFRVFQNLKAVLETAVADNDLIPNGDPDDLNAKTVFSIPENTAELSSPDTLEGCLQDDPDLREPKNVAALTTQGQKAQQILANCLGRLLGAGIESFQLRDLKEAVIRIIKAAGVDRQIDNASSTLRSDDDRDLADLFSAIQKTSGQEPRTNLADTRYDEAEDFERKVRIAHDAIDQLSNRSTTKERLHRVLDSVAASRTATVTEDSESLANIKNRKELLEELGVSKSTISEDLQTLSKLWRELETES